MTPAPRVALYGYFGMGNLGNEGSLAAFVEYLRRHHPDLSLTCLAAGPAAVQRDHGIPAVRLMAYQGVPDRGRPDVVRKVTGRLLDIPRTFLLLRGVDLLVVPGTGVLEKTPAVKPWGLPYWLFVATLLSRLRRARVALVCVGADPPPDRITRWLYRQTVSHADHCSYRDEESYRAMAAMGLPARQGGASHDLAFSLPPPPVETPARRRVVVGVMRYEGAPSDPGRGPARVRHYVATIVALVQRFATQGREVVLVVGDESDRPLAEEVARVSLAGLPATATPAVVVSAAATLDEVMREMSGADLVVATRFHHLVCALKMTRPTVSIGYAAKSRNLMDRFGLGAFTMEIEDVDLEAVWRAATEVEARREELEPRMRQALTDVTCELARHLHALPLADLTRGHP